MMFAGLFENEAATARLSARGAHGSCILAEGPCAVLRERTWMLCSIKNHACSLLKPISASFFPSVLLGKVVAEYKSQKQAAKEKKKKKKDKKAGKKDKKDKKDGKTKKDRKIRKEKDASDEDETDEEVKKEHHEVKEKRRKRIMLDDAGQPTGKEELEVLEASLFVWFCRQLPACFFCACHAGQK